MTQDPIEGTTEWTASAVLEVVRAAITSARATHPVPGVGVGVLVDGEVQTTGLGQTSVQDGSPVGGDTQFRLCSVTKPMTSTLALALVDEGILDLDEPVVRRLPELRLADSSARERLALRHLLLHTSGLEGEWRGSIADYGDGPDALGRMVGDYDRLDQYAEPGLWWGYCNTGYWLAGHLIARATGSTYEDALRERLLDPLGMRDTVLDVAAADPGRMARPHRVRGADVQPVGNPTFPRARVPSGGVISSARDVLRFAAMHLDPGESAPLDRSGVERLRVPHVPAAEPGDSQSLGWRCLPGATPVVGHSGAYDGYASLLFVVPEHKIAVVVLTNGDAGGRLATAALDAVRSQVLEEPSVDPGPVEVDRERLVRLTGTYRHPSVERSTVRLDDGGLTLTAEGRRSGEGRLVACSETGFTVDGGPFSGVPVQFLPDPSAPEAPVPHLRIQLRLGARIDG